MFNMGLENLETSTENVDDQVQVMSFEEAVLASTEAAMEGMLEIQAIEDEFAALEAMENAFANLVAVKDVVSQEGVSASLVALVGKSLEKVTPSLANGGEAEVVVGELEASEEGFAAKIIATIKNIIAKVIAFFKRLFGSQDKMAKGLDAMIKDVDYSKVDWKAIKEKEVLGVEFSKYKALMGSSEGALEKAGKALGDAYFGNKSAEECAKAFNSIAKTAIGLELTPAGKIVVADKSFFTFEKKSLEKLMFASVDDVMKHAKTAAGMTDKAMKSAEKQLKWVEGECLKVAKEADDKNNSGKDLGDGKDKLAWAPAKFAGLFSQISSKTSGMAFKLLQQQTAMAKIVVAASKGGKAPEGDKGGNDGDGE